MFLIRLAILATTIASWQVNINALGEQIEPKEQPVQCSTGAPLPSTTTGNQSRIPAAVFFGSPERETSNEKDSANTRPEEIAGDNAKLAAEFADILFYIWYNQRFAENVDHWTKLQIVKHRPQRYNCLSLAQIRTSLRTSPYSKLISR